ncbi:MAG: helix-turn-helix domain-containing protein [Victivallales bacterium]|nr:helix-turn-helix domain-containing protein [Victivallales bacterium]
MKAIQALSKDFFIENAFPIALRSIHGDEHDQHPGDLTDIEHWHDFAELVIITEGYGIQSIDGTGYPVSAGDIFVFQGRTRHYFTERHGLSMHNIMYDSQRLRNSFKNLAGTAGYNAMFLLEPAYRRRHRFKSRLRISRRSLAHVEPIISKMYQEQEKMLPGFDTLMLSMLLDLVVFFSRQYSHTAIPQAQALYRIGKIISRLETRCQENWTISQLAKIAAMSKSSLIAVFKEATGYSPIDYLIRIRLQKAAELLQESDASMSEIAAQCGFHDTNYLTRQFRRIYNQTPRQYRRNNL